MELLAQIAVRSTEVNALLHSSTGGRMISEWAKRPEFREAAMGARYSEPVDNIPKFS